MAFIFKYPLEWTIGTPQNVEMPKGADVLTVQMQDGKPTMWAEVPDLSARVERRRFTIIGTGTPFVRDVDGPTIKRYIGTVQDGLYRADAERGDNRVWHIYEESDNPG